MSEFGDLLENAMRVEDISEGKVPKDQDSEDVKIKKLTEKSKFEVKFVDKEGKEQTEVVESRREEFARKIIEKEFEPKKIISVKKVEKDNADEGYKTPGKRDRTGPAKGSWQRKQTRDKGKRKLAGEECPEESKVDEQDEESPFDKAPEGEEEVDVGKEYVGSKGDIYYYLVSGDGEGVADLKVMDAEDNEIFTIGDREDIEDVSDFVIAAIQEMDIDDISYDLFAKYVLPKLVEEEEEEEVELPAEVEGEEMPAESVVLKRGDKRFEAIWKDDKFSLGGKVFEFSKWFIDSYMKEEKLDLNKLAQDVFETLSEDEVERLQSKKISEDSRGDYEAEWTITFTDEDGDKGEDTVWAVSKDHAIDKFRADFGSGVKINKVKFTGDKEDLQTNVYGETEENVAEDKILPTKQDTKSGKKGVKVGKPKGNLDKEKPQQLKGEVAGDKLTLEDLGKYLDDGMKERLEKALANEKKKPPVCKKCGQRHWPMLPCPTKGKKKDKEKKEKK